MSELYGSVSEADTYFADRDLEGKWSTFNTSQKSRSLQIATDLVDALEYDGEFFSGTDQTLQFPRIVHAFASRRSFVWDLNTSGTAVVPEDVKRATFEQARLLLIDKNDSLPAKIRRGLVSISVGLTSEGYGEHARLSIDRRTGLYREATRLLEKYLLRGY